MSTVNTFKGLGNQIAAAFIANDEVTGVPLLKAAKKAAMHLNPGTSPEEARAAFKEGASAWMDAVDYTDDEKAGAIAHFAPTDFRKQGTRAVVFCAS